MEQQDLVTLTADIVAAHVSNNNVGVGGLGNLIENVHRALAALASPPPAAEPEKKKPAVSIRASVKPDYLVCMECGSRHKLLKRHLATAHGMTPQQYRADHGLPADYPVVAPNYSEARREFAHSIGLGRKGGRKRASSTSKAPAAGRRPAGKGNRPSR